LNQEFDVNSSSEQQRWWLTIGSARGRRRRQSRLPGAARGVCSHSARSRCPCTASTRRWLNSSLYVGWWRSRYRRTLRTVSPTLAPACPACSSCRPRRRFCRAGGGRSASATHRVNCTAHLCTPHAHRTGLHRTARCTADQRRTLSSAGSLSRRCSNERGRGSLRGSPPSRTLKFLRTCPSLAPPSLAPDEAVALVDCASLRRVEGVRPHGSSLPIPSPVETHTVRGSARARARVPARRATGKQGVKEHGCDVVVMGALN